MYQSNFLKLFFLFFLFLSLSYSWGWDTHEWAAEHICEYTGCGECLEELKAGSIAPDKIFKDTINHHCYDPEIDCKKGDWICPDYYDCPAIEKYEEWLKKAENETGCDRYYAIGVASHYFLDSKVFWHQVKNESMSKCHSPFESRVNLLINRDFFTVEFCGISVTKKEIKNYVHEFELNFKPAPIFEEEKPKWYLEPGFLMLLIVIVFAIIIIALIFKRRKNKG